MAPLHAAVAALSRSSSSGSTARSTRPRPERAIVGARDLEARPSDPNGAALERPQQPRPTGTATSSAESEPRSLVDVARVEVTPCRGTSDVPTSVASTRTPCRRKTSRNTGSPPCSCIAAYRLGRTLARDWPRCCVSPPLARVCSSRSREASAWIHQLFASWRDAWFPGWDCRFLGWRHGCANFPRTPLGRALSRPPALDRGPHPGTAPRLHTCGVRRKRGFVLCGLAAGPSTRPPWHSSAAVPRLEGRNRPGAIARSRGSLVTRLELWVDSTAHTA